MNITIVKILIQNKYQAETLELIYTSKTKTYSTPHKLKEFGSLIYKDLIKMLDKTYGYTWGIKFYKAIFFL